VPAVDNHLAQLQAVRDEVRAAVREAHEVLRDLKAERRELEKLVGDENMRRLLDEAFDRVLSEPVKKQLDAIVVSIEAARQSSISAIDRWLDLMVTGKEHGMRETEIASALVRAPDQILARELARRAHDILDYDAVDAIAYHGTEEQNRELSEQIGQWVNDHE